MLEWAQFLHWYYFVDALAITSFSMGFNGFNWIVQHVAKSENERHWEQNIQSHTHTQISWNCDTMDLALSANKSVETRLAYFTKKCRLYYRADEIKWIVRLKWLWMDCCSIIANTDRSQNRPNIRSGKTLVQNGKSFYEKLNMNSALRC